MTFSRKIYIYFSLFIKVIYNLIILIILLISKRNIKLLKSYQKLYLFFSIFIWVLLVIILISKLAVIILLSIINKKMNCGKIAKIILLLSWKIPNISAYIIMLIAFLYDICQIFKGNLSSIIYEFAFWIICYIFIRFSINDYHQLDIILSLICTKVKNETETKDDKNENLGKKESIIKNNKQKIL